MVCTFTSQNIKFFHCLWYSPRSAVCHFALEMEMANFSETLAVQRNTTWSQTQKWKCESQENHLLRLKNVSLWTQISIQLLSCFQHNFPSFTPSSFVLSLGQERGNKIAGEFSHIMSELNVQEFVGRTDDSCFLYMLHFCKDGRNYKFKFKLKFPHRLLLLES